jgi:hypothetical protein
MMSDLSEQFPFTSPDICTFYYFPTRNDFKEMVGQVGHDITRSMKNASTFPHGDIVVEGCSAATRDPTPGSGP